MLPFDRFKQFNTVDNLWIYILTLANKQPLIDNEIDGLIFEKFGFLPGKFTLMRVLYSLEINKFIQTEKQKGRMAYRTTKKGTDELKKMKYFCQELLKKI